MGEVSLSSPGSGRSYSRGECGEQYAASLESRSLCPGSIHSSLAGVDIWDAETRLIVARRRRLEYTRLWMVGRHTSSRFIEAVLVPCDVENLNEQFCYILDSIPPKDVEGSPCSLGTYSCVVIQFDGCAASELMKTYANLTRHSLVQSKGGQKKDVLTFDHGFPLDSHRLRELVAAHRYPPQLCTQDTTITISIVQDWFCEILLDAKLAFAQATEDVASQWSEEGEEEEDCDSKESGVSLSPSVPVICHSDPVAPRTGTLSRVSTSTMTPASTTFSDTRKKMRLLALSKHRSSTTRRTLVANSQDPPTHGGAGTASEAARSRPPTVEVAGSILAGNLVAGSIVPTTLLNAGATVESHDNIAHCTTQKKVSKCIQT